MPVNTTPLRTFIKSLHKWLEAVDRGQHDLAEFEAANIKALGYMVSIDPEFKRIFFENVEACKAHNPQEALDCLNSFLIAVNSAMRST